MTDNGSFGARFGLSDPQQRLFIAAIVLVVTSTLFGGASRDNPIRLAVVELSSLPLLMMALSRLASSAKWRTFTGGFWVLAAIYGVVLAQLIPLPPQIWTNLPGHAAEARALTLSGLPLSWRPISLTPQDSETSVLALVPPTAMFLAVLGLSSSNLKSLLKIWMVLAAASLILGAFQLRAAYEGSPAYPYRVTHYGSVVGFFANRNHEASLLLALIPFAAVLATDRREGSARLWQILGTLFILIACVGLAAVRSRMGIVLAAPAILLSGLIVWRSPNSRTQFRYIVGASSVIVATVFIAGFFAFGPILDRFEQNLHDETRFLNWPFVEQAADQYLPLGSGIGSFDLVFRSVEPLTIVQQTYFNHAHNEYLEVWLETGWLGIGVFLAFLWWAGRLAVRAWVKHAPDLEMSRAASVAVLLLLAHSFVDYPLRTTTISVLFAFACAVLASRGLSSSQRRKESRSARSADVEPGEAGELAGEG